MRSSCISVTLLLFFALLAVTGAAFTDDEAPCSSKEECCLLCGDHSERCARGPCSMNVMARGILSLSIPTEDIGIWDIIFSFYGLVPYVVPVLILLEFIFHRRGWTRVFAFLVIPLFAIITSIVFVRSLGECSECERPCGSCVFTNGMPSGHATSAIGLCLWLMLETLLGVGKQWKMTMKMALCVIYIVLLVPVPYSRMYLGDHTELQAVIGSANGVVFGLVYFLVLRYVIGRRLPAVTERMKHGCFWKLKMTNDIYMG